MQTIIALIIVAAAAFIAVRSILRRSKKGACGCDRCPVQKLPR
jgi:hypothetical protein